MNRVSFDDVAKMDGPQLSALAGAQSLAGAARRLIPHARVQPGDPVPGNPASVAPAQMPTQGATHTMPDGSQMPGATHPGADQAPPYAHPQSQLMQQGPAAPNPTEGLPQGQGQQDFVSYLSQILSPEERAVIEQGLQGQQGFQAPRPMQGDGTGGVGPVRQMTELRRPQPMQGVPVQQGDGTGGVGPVKFATQAQMAPSRYEAGRALGQQLRRGGGSPKQ